MAIQDFTAGQILTAAQMDALQANDYNQTVSTKTDNYVLVAADKGTRTQLVDRLRRRARAKHQLRRITRNQSRYNEADDRDPGCHEH